MTATFPLTVRSYPTHLSVSFDGNKLKREEKNTKEKKKRERENEREGNGRCR